MRKFEYLLLAEISEDIDVIIDLFDAIDIFCHSLLRTGLYTVEDPTFQNSETVKGTDQ